MNNVTKCPCCQKINIDAAAEGYVDFPREYHADCWSRIDAIVDQLNEYDGTNIWADVIFGVDGYDDEATAKIDAGRSDRFAVGQVIICWDEPNKTWQVDGVVSDWI